MNIIGKWKVGKVGVFDIDEGLQMKTLEQVMAMEETDEIRETKEMANATFLWVTAKTMQLRAIMPPEAVEEAKAAGEEIPFNKDGSVTLQKMPWKEEDGKILYNMGDECEIDGEDISPWQAAEFDEDGMLVIGMMGFVKE